MMNFKDKLCGMNSHYRFYSFERFFQEMNRLGIKNVEIWTGPMHFYVDYNKNQSVEQLKEYYCRMVDIAKEVNAQHILITTGWAYYDESKEDAWNRSVEMMRKVCDYAKANNILVAIEALQPDESVLANSVEQLKAYLDAVNHPQLKVCIDFGAMARVNNTIQDYFDAFGKDVIHTHFVDGKPTGHLAWSDGTRDLKQDLLDLEANGYHGYLSLETATSRYYEKPWVAEQTTLKAFEKLGKEEK